MNSRDSLSNSNRLDEFFFQILQLIHEIHNDYSEYLKSFLHEKTESAPRWENFNQHQVEQHAKQLEEVL
jgi:hypothetical protein